VNDVTYSGYFVIITNTTELIFANVIIELFQHSSSLFIHLKNIKMGNLLYVVAVILIIAWAIGFIGYSAGGIIHVLLVIAVIAILVRVIQGRRPV
jgi:uncharacterized membrane protein YtjA (UPF0391 family)